MKRPLALWLLVSLLVTLSVGGFFGGLAMLIDPSGGILQMTDVLKRLPVPDFTLPGLFLFAVMGAFPLLLVYGLIARPRWKRFQGLFAWSGYYWAWTGTVSLVAVLGLWLILQGLLIGFQWPIQFITAGNGLLIHLCALLPSVRKYFSLDKSGRS